jgi:hypothetical protein
VSKTHSSTTSTREKRKASHEVNANPKFPKNPTLICKAIGVQRKDKWFFKFERDEKFKIYTFRVTMVSKKNIFFPHGKGA